jgi:hypothetical protein
MARPPGPAVEKTNGRLKPLRDLLNFAAANAGSANPHAFSSPIHQGADSLQIQVPAALGDVVGVTDLVTELRLAAAHIANLSHKTEISSMNLN